jgi:hypothetical protein
MFLPPTDPDATSSRRRPSILEQLEQISDALPFDENVPVPLRVIGLRTDGKMKTFEWQEEGFLVPPRVLTDSVSAALIERGLSFAEECEPILAKTFRQYFGGDANRTDRFRHTRSQMLQEYWQRLATPFREYVLSLAHGPDESAFQRWLDTVQRQAINTFEEAASHVGDDAAALRQRVQAVNHCRARLSSFRNETHPRSKTT